MPVGDALPFEGEEGFYDAVIWETAERNIPLILDAPPSMPAAKVDMPNLSRIDGRADAFMCADYFGTKIWGCAPKCVDNLSSVSVAVRSGGQWRCYEAFPVFERDKAAEAGYTPKNEEGAFSLTIEEELDDNVELYVIQEGETTAAYEARAAVADGDSEEP